MKGEIYSLAFFGRNSHEHHLFTRTRVAESKVTGFRGPVCSNITLNAERSFWLLRSMVTMRAFSDSSTWISILQAFPKASNTCQAMCYRSGNWMVFCIPSFYQNRLSPRWRLAQGS